MASYRNDYVDFAWVHKYPPDRFWHIVYGMGGNELPNALALAKQRNAGWVYFTEEAGNPYATPPHYWSAEAAAIEQQAVQSPFASAWPDSFDAQGARARGRTSIRWSGTSANWQIFIDTDQNSKTGYNGGGISLGAEYLFEADGGAVHLFKYAGTGPDWNWTEVAANAVFDDIDVGIQVASFDTAALASSRSLNYQIRALDTANNPTYDSYVMPLSLDTRGLIFDITNHP
jgi:hypothetical protein